MGHPLSRRAPGTCAGRTLQISRGGRDRTCDLTVPNRARCRCATPRFVLRKERESNPQGSSLIRFRDGCHHPLACPSRAVVVGRVGIEPTSYGLRDRCNASICYRPVAPMREKQARSSFGLPRLAPPLGVEPRPSVFRTDAQTAYARVGKMGYLAIPLVLNYAVVKGHQ